LVSMQSRTIVFGDERVLARKIGADDLRHWTAVHAPLQQSMDSAASRPKA
jgi:hypothetical protein